MVCHRGIKALTSPTTSISLLTALRHLLVSMATPTIIYMLQARSNLMLLHVQLAVDLSPESPPLSWQLPSLKHFKSQGGMYGYCALVILSGCTQLQVLDLGAASSSARLGPWTAGWS